MPVYTRSGPSSVASADMWVRLGGWGESFCEVRLRGLTDRDRHLGSEHAELSPVNAASGTIRYPAGRAARSDKL